MAKSSSSETANKGEAAEKVVPGMLANDMSVYEILCRERFFRGMKEEHLHTLAASGMHTILGAGQFVLQRGDPANRFYLLLKGSVVVASPDRNGVVHRLQVVGPGEVLGWSWMFPPYYWHFDAVAAEATEAIFFYGSRLRAECNKNPEFGYELMRRVSEVVISRLQKTRQEWIKARET